MRHILFLLLGIALVFLLVQCQPDTIEVTPVDTPDPITNTDSTGTTGTPDSTTTAVPGDTIYVNADITADVTWASGNTYVLEDLIAVTNGATLTIESCVVVKAAQGATGLVIAQGASIDAQGSATCPIIFTAESDSILPGAIASPNLTAADKGLWGGIFILGEAPVSTMISPAIMRHLPVAYAYGGSNAAHSSGIFSYVSIRHAGHELVQDEPPCGLMLAGVGQGTTIDHVELFANADDGLVVLGGTVNLQHVITSAFSDDAVDCDEGYGGTIDGLIGIGGTKGNASLELDGGEGATNPTFTIRNASFKGGQSEEHYIEFQQHVNCLIERAYFFGFDAASEVKLERDSDADNWLASLIDVADLEFNTSHLTTGNTTLGAIFVDRGLNGNDAFVLRAPDASLTTTPSVGANPTEFTGWTLADLNGSLADF